MTTPEEELRKQEAPKAHKESGHHEQDIGFLGQLIDNAGKAVNDAKNIAIDQVSGTHSGDKVLSSISPALAAQYERGKALEEQVNQKTLSGKISPEQQKDLDAYHQVKKSISQVPLYDRESLTRYVEKGIHDKAAKDKTHVDKPTSEKPLERSAVKPEAEKPLSAKAPVERNLPISQDLKPTLNVRESNATQGTANRPQTRTEPSSQDLPQQKTISVKGDVASITGVPVPSAQALRNTEQAAKKPNDNAVSEAPLNNQKSVFDKRTSSDSNSSSESSRRIFEGRSTSESNSRHEASLEMRQEARPAPKLDSKFDPKFESKSELKPELKPELKSEQKPPSNLQLKLEMELEKGRAAQTSVSPESGASPVKPSPEVELKTKVADSVTSVARPATSSENKFVAEKTHENANQPPKAESVSAAFSSVGSARKTLSEIKGSVEHSVIEQISHEKFPNGISWQARIEPVQNQSINQPTESVSIRQTAGSASTKQTQQKADSAATIPVHKVIPNSVTDVNVTRLPGQSSLLQPGRIFVQSATEQQSIAKTQQTYTFNNRVEQRYITGAEIALAAIFAAAGAKRVRQDPGAISAAISLNPNVSINDKRVSVAKPQEVQTLPNTSSFTGLHSSHDPSRLTLSDVQTFSTSTPISAKRFLTGAEILLASLLASSGVSKIRQHFSEIEIAPQTNKISPSDSDVSSQNKRIDVVEDKHDEERISPTSVSSSHRRMTVLMGLDETLVSIADKYLHDENLGWLIADLNISKAKESYVDGKRVLEIQSRTSLELPGAIDISNFIRERPPHAVPENLITIVLETQVDQELLNSELGLFVEDKKMKPAQDSL
ncbi:MAG: hypothetical protein IAF58_08880 [Leptolyngbya sp.]|nr:hypothetical protein [Candidatus Melainabacteria bacterium]